MVKGKTNGLDVTLKCISMMLCKAIVVLAEDYLWFTHKCPIKDMEIVMTLRQDGKFCGVRRKDCKMLECNLPYLKDWMESQFLKVYDEASSENTDQTENLKPDVENGSENTDMAQYNVETDSVQEKHEQVNLHNSDGQENVYHLKITDITSGDSEVLVPSSNAEIAGKMNIHGNVSDTTFDESMKMVQSVQQSVHEHTSDECTRNGTEVKDMVVQSGIVNGTNEKIHVESDQSRSDAKEDN